MPDLPNELRARIGGKSWRVRFLRAREVGARDGICIESPHVMKIRRTLSGRKLLETVVHEMLHAEHWQIDEEYVERTAADIARLLWRLGYRRES